MKIQFLGGVGTVTGSKTLIEVGGKKTLVDCGLFQGLKDLRLKNREPFPIPPAEIDEVLLTHAHLDHTGYLPLLVKQGFRGTIYASRPTRELTELILKDSARIQEEDAEFANREGFSKHHPALPLYTTADVENALSRIRTVKPDRWIELGEKMRFRLTPSGHLLGSTFIELETPAGKIVFSGDLGRRDPFLYPPPRRIASADYLVIESTYGDRLHTGSARSASTLRRLEEIVTETAAREGQVLIPSFAVGRVQDLLLLFARLKDEGKLRSIPVYLDSPMGIDATRIFAENPSWHRLAPDEVRGFIEATTLVRSRAESIAVMRSKKPAIILAGSGMMTGGRILHHLAAKLEDDRNTVVLAGYQAAGTRGRLLEAGAAELKIHGRFVPVRARVERIGAFSAHADQAEIIDWLSKFSAPPKKTFINHGEPQAADALRVKIRDRLGWDCRVPHEFEVIELAEPERPEEKAESGEGTGSIEHPVRRIRVPTITRA